MQKVVIVADKYREWKKGEVVEVHNNEAHALVESGTGKLWTPPADQVGEIPYKMPADDVPPVPSPEEEVVDLGEYHKCEVCGRSFDSKRGLSLHSRVHDKEMSAESNKGYKTK